MKSRKERMGKRKKKRSRFHQDVKKQKHYQILKKNYGQHWGWGGALVVKLSYSSNISFVCVISKYSYKSATFTITFYQCH